MLLKYIVQYLLHASGVLEFPFEGKKGRRLNTVVY